MKTSKIIIIAFFSLIIAGMLALFINTKNHNENFKKNYFNKEFRLPSFSVIVAEQGADINVNKSDSNSISIEYIKNEKAPAKLYSIQNDTLHIYNGLRMFIKGNKINTVIGQNARWVEIVPFTTDSLILKSKGGRLYLRNATLNETKGRIKISCIGITATDSAEVGISEVDLKNITVYSSNSEVKLNCRINSMKSIIEHKARFTSYYTPEVIDVKRDSTSTVDIFGRR